MKNLLLLMVIAAAGASAGAEDVQVSIEQPELFCQVGAFSPRKGKPAIKKCDALKDAKEVKVSNFGECKERATKAATACLKRANVDQVAVMGKFLERFKITSNTTTFTCELDKAGGSACD